MSAHPLPDHALLARYRVAGRYTDCFTTRAPGRVTLPDYVDAFYNSWLFRLERWILEAALGKPSADAEARRVATGAQQIYAAWSVEGRTEDQLLMCDFRGDTRSWFMVAPEDDGTRLYFGSAVVPRGVDRATGEPRLGGSYRALLGFHKLYSRALLARARARLT